MITTDNAGCTKKEGPMNAKEIKRILDKHWIGWDDFDAGGAAAEIAKRHEAEKTAQLMEMRAIVESAKAPSEVLDDMDEFLDKALSAKEKNDER